MLYRAMLMVLCVVGGGLIPRTSALADDRPAMLTAARELNRQMTTLQDLFGSDPRLLQINGLLQQTIDFQNALFDFRQKVSNNASHEDLVIAFDIADRNLSGILAEIRLVEQADPSVKVVCRYIRSAASALHFAVFSGDAAPARQYAGLLRQTLSQLDFVQSLSNNVSWLFAGREALAGWNNDLAKLQQSLTALQGLEQNKATADEIKKQFRQVDANWDAIYQRYQIARQQDQLLLRGFIILVDQGFGRMATLVGVNDRRASLAD